LSPVVSATALGGPAYPDSELDFRLRALRVGSWLGWLSIAVVLVGFAFDTGSRHEWPFIGLTLAAAAANLVATLAPWKDWLPTRRGQILLDIWSGGLIAFVALLVYAGGANFTLLLFLAVPFIAVVQEGGRRVFWLVASAATCALAAALIPLPAGATAMRLALVGAAVAIALVLAGTVERASRLADHQRTVATEANHRIKNNLQTVADLLLLGRPEDEAGRAFDETAARIRSIATVHRLLSESQDSVPVAPLLASIAAGMPAPVTVDVDPVSLDGETAQNVGLVANELITNAFRHGAPPIALQLRGGRQTRLRVVDAGTGAVAASGLGLELVRRTVEQGLGGRFELTTPPEGGTRAEVVFPT
jgi:two-component sensor histidine kinase